MATTKKDNRFYRKQQEMIDRILAADAVGRGVIYFAWTCGPLYEKSERQLLQTVVTVCDMLDGQPS